MDGLFDDEIYNFEKFEEYKKTHPREAFIKCERFCAHGGHDIDGEWMPTGGYYLDIESGEYGNIYTYHAEMSKLYCKDIYSDSYKAESRFTVTLEIKHIGMSYGDTVATFKTRSKKKAIEILYDKMIELESSKEFVDNQWKIATKKRTCMFKKCNDNTYRYKFSVLFGPWHVLSKYDSPLKYDYNTYLGEFWYPEEDNYHDKGKIYFSRIRSLYSSASGGSSSNNPEDFKLSLKMLGKTALEGTLLKYFYDKAGEQNAL
jgi:hypothetical protein